MAKRNKPLVLVIDDDAWIQRVVKKKLEQCGAEVKSAVSPVAGISFAVNNLPDLIILDILMPGIDGEMAFRMLRSIHATRNIPIVIVSANISPEILKKTHREGTIGYLTKPFTTEKLYEMVKGILEKDFGDKCDEDDFSDQGDVIFDSKD
jgi:CheY-like chemotaxis protein